MFSYIAVITAIAVIFCLAQEYFCKIKKQLNVVETKLKIQQRMIDSKEDELRTEIAHHRFKRLAQKLQKHTIMDRLNKVSSSRRDTTVGVFPKKMQLMRTNQPTNLFDYICLHKYNPTEFTAQVRKLLDATFSPNEKVNSIPLLSYAVIHADLNVIDLLLNAGAVIDAQDEKGETALHHACSNCLFEITSHLIKRGASKEIFSNEGELPWDIATRLESNGFNREISDKVLQSF